MLSAIEIFNQYSFFLFDKAVGETSIKFIQNNYWILLLNLIR